MGGQLAVVSGLAMRPAAGPVHRSIVVVDIEASTTRTNPERGELRRVLYALLDQALRLAGINAGHLEPMADRGDGVLILIKPYDDVPKTVLLGVFIPALATLLAEHNVRISHPALRIRLRAVVHAGEIHDDGRGFYGEDLDVAFRLLNAQKVKETLRETPAAPLVLVVSEAIFTGIVRHRYVDADGYEPLVRVRVAELSHRGWVHLPPPGTPDRLVAVRHEAYPQLAPPRNIAPAETFQLDRRVPA
jgi:hypothetical protein